MRSTAQCRFAIEARVVEGGRQRDRRLPGAEEQTTAGTILGGTGRYRHARGTLTGSGTVVDTATRLSDVHLAYHLATRASA